MLFRAEPPEEHSPASLNSRIFPELENSRVTASEFKPVAGQWLTEKLVQIAVTSQSNKPSTLNLKPRALTPKLLCNLELNPPYQEPLCRQPVCCAIASTM